MMIADITIKIMSIEGHQGMRFADSVIAIHPCRNSASVMN